MISATLLLAQYSENSAAQLPRVTLHLRTVFLLSSTQEGPVEVWIIPSMRVDLYFWVGRNDWWALCVSWALGVQSCITALSSHASRFLSCLKNYLILFHVFFRFLTWLLRKNKRQYLRITFSLHVSLYVYQNEDKHRLDIKILLGPKKYDDI